ncbi:hypothetical protein ACOSP7_015816 [Xanthoceras sorbifolium]
MIDSDGAAALVLVSGETAAKHGFQVIGKITAYADAIQQSPNIRWSDIYLGKESMSNALKYLAEARKGSRLGHSSLLMECQRRIMGMIRGAAALVLVSGETAAKHGFQVIGKITAYADAIQAPEIFATAPAIVGI